MQNRVYVATEEPEKPAKTATSQILRRLVGRWLLQEGGMAGLAPFADKMPPK
jgi:hypothetical protein